MLLDIFKKDESMFRSFQNKSTTKNDFYDRKENITCSYGIKSLKKIWIESYNMGVIFQVVQIKVLEVDQKAGI